MNMHLGFFVVYEKLQFISLFNKILAFTFYYFLRGKNCRMKLLIQQQINIRKALRRAENLLSGSLTVGRAHP